jgi:hypothetical protein
MAFQWSFLLLIVVILFLVFSFLSFPYLGWRKLRWIWWEGVVTGRNRSWYIAKGAAIWHYLRMGKEDRVGRYHALNNREIRLLEIIHGDETSQVACTLHNAFLDDPTISYEALSYTWGNPFRRSIITLNGKKCHVTHNLHRALRRLRQLNSNRVIWADSVCINQANFEERSEQVKLMGEIYEKASQVVVWLGEGGHRRDDAVEFLQEAGMQRDLEEWLRSTIGQSHYSDSWKAITQILAEDYWTRVWIIQEIAKATRPMVLYGPQAIEWISLVACQRVWAQERWREGRTPSLEKWFLHVEQTFYPPRQTQEHHFRPWLNELHSRIEYQVFLRGLGAVVGPRILEDLRIQLQSDSSADSLSLLNILCAHWYSLATNNLDKIFALVGLSTAPQFGEYPIDYTKSEAEAHADLVTFLINSTRKLDVICYTGTLSIVKGFPTWMPFWGDNDKSWMVNKQTYMKFNEDEILLASNDPAHDLPRIVGKQPFSASAKIPAISEVTTSFRRRIVWSFSLRQTMYFMRTEGCCIDKISHIVWDFDMQTSLSFRRFPGFQYGDRTGFRDNTRDYLKIVLFNRFLRRSDRIKDLGLERSVPLSAMPTMAAWRACSLAEDPATYRLIQDIKLVFRLAIETSQPSLSNPGHIADLDERLEAIWRTIIFNRTTEGEVPPAKWGHVFEVLLNDGIGVPDDFLAGSNPRLTPLERARAYVLPYLAAMRRALKGRCIFITEKGRLGLGTYYAGRGDLVCVLFGCSMPVLIDVVNNSKQSESLGEMPIPNGRFHGAAYFHGYMDGRAIQECDAGILPRRGFSLS